MSSHIKDQQQQQTKDPQRDFDADHLFNQHLMKTLAYTGIGFGFGMLSSLFFKHRAGMTMFFAGTGAGYGALNFMNDLDHYKKFQSYNKDFQQQQPQTFQRQGQIESQDWQKYMPKEQSQSQQKNYQRGGSDDDDNKSESQSREDERDLTYSQKLAEAGAKKDEAKGVKPKGGYDDTKNNAREEQRSQKSSETKKQDTSRQESSSNKQQESKKDQSKGQDHQQKEEAWKDQLKSGSTQLHEQQNNKKDLNEKHNSKENLKSSQHSGETKQQSSKLASSSKDKHQSKPESVSANQLDHNTFLKVEGQQFMDVRSNPHDAGKPKPGEDIYRGSFRSTKPSNHDQAKDNQSHRAEQDRIGHTPRTGNKMKLEHPDHSLAGSQFAGDNLSAKSQVNAVIE